MNWPSANDPYEAALPQGVRLQVRRSWIDLFLIAGFFVFSCDVIDKFLRPVGVDNLVFFAFYGISILLLLISGYAGAILRRAPLLLLLILLPLISIFWSVDAKLTLVRSIELLGSSLFAVLAGWHLAANDLIRRLAVGFALMVVGSFAVIFALPSFGIGQDEAWGGTWVGLSLHKNGLGGSASLAVLVLTYVLLIAKNRFIPFVAWVLAVILLIGSKSATAQMVTLIGLGLGVFILIYQTKPTLGLLLALIGAVGVPLIVWAFIAFDIGPMIVSMMGKDTTLGSRMGIWELVWPYIEDRWWLGYGYGAFWQPDLPWVDQVTARLNFTPYYSHNGVVEMMLGGGMILVIITSCVYLIALVRSVVPIIRAPQDWHHAFAFVFMVTFVLRNLTEAAALTRNDIAWVLFVALATSLARDVGFRLVPKAA